MNKHHNKIKFKKVIQVNYKVNIDRDHHKEDNKITNNKIINNKCTVINNKDKCHLNNKVIIHHQCSNNLNHSNKNSRKLHMQEEDLAQEADLGKEAECNINNNSSSLNSIIR